VLFSLQGQSKKEAIRFDVEVDFKLNSVSLFEY